jgi:hypothetical protein
MGMLSLIPHAIHETSRYNASPETRISVGGKSLAAEGCQGDEIASRSYEVETNR